MTLRKKLASAILALETDPTQEELDALNTLLLSMAPQGGGQTSGGNTNTESGNANAESGNTSIGTETTNVQDSLSSQAEAGESGNGSQGSGTMPSIPTFEQMVAGTLQTAKGILTTIDQGLLTGFAELNKSGFIKVEKFEDIEKII